MISWLAALAILLSALAPTLSYAMPGKPDLRFAEICSASGHTYSADPALTVLQGGKLPASDLQQSQPGQGHSDAMAMQHCPYCLNHASAHGVPLPSEFLLAAPQLSYSLPSLYYQSPAPLFAWASASPRAPPYTSL